MNFGNFGKKLLVLSLMLSAGLTVSAPAKQEDTPLFFDHSGGVMYEIEEDNNDLINYSSMKKSEKIENAMNEKEEKEQKSRIKLDTRQIQHQKALDYTTRQINSIPLF